MAKAKKYIKIKQITFVRFGFDDGARVWVMQEANKTIFVVKLISDNIIYCQTFVFLFLQKLKREREEEKSWKNNE